MSDSVRAQNEIEEIGEFFGEIFEFVDDYRSVEAAKKAIDAIGLRNFFEYDVANKRVADIGCGYGRATLEMLLGGAERVVAVDMSKEQLARTQSVITQAGYADKVEFRNMSADRLSLPDESFDVVVSLGVILILPDFEKALDELCRITRPGGVLFFATLGKRGIVPQARRLLRQATTHVPYRYIRSCLRALPIARSAKYIIADTLWSKYYHQHSVTELSGLLKDRGLEIVKIGDIYASKSPFYRMIQGEGYIHIMARKNDRR